MFRRSIVDVALGCFLVLISTVAVISTCAAADDATINRLKEQLVLANKILDYEGLARPLGHISVRVPGTDTFLIAGSIAPGLVTFDDIVVCDMTGKVIQGKHKNTYGEVAAHIGVYKKRSDINSVAHVHPKNVIALSMTRTPILPASIDALGLGKKPIAIYNKVVFVNKLEYGEEIADLLGPNKAVSLRGHGAVVVGNTVAETTENALRMESAASLQLMASSAGTVLPLAEEETKEYYEFISWIEKRGGSGSERFWEIYKHLLKDK